MLPKTFLLIFGLIFLALLAMPGQAISVYYNNSYENNQGNWTSISSQNRIYYLDFLPKAGGNQTSEFLQFWRNTTSTSGIFYDNQFPPYGVKPDFISFYMNCPQAAEQEVGFYTNNSFIADSRILSIDCDLGTLYGRSNSTPFKIVSGYFPGDWWHIQIQLFWNNATGIVTWSNGTTEVSVYNVNFSNSHPINGTYIFAGIPIVGYLNFDHIQVWNITDSKAPDVTIQSPANGAALTNRSINLSYTITPIDDLFSELGCDYYVLYSDGTNAIPKTAVPSCGNITFNLPTDGNFMLYMNSHDLFGFENTTNVNFSATDVTPVEKVGAAASERVRIERDTENEKKEYIIDYGLNQYGYTVLTTPKQDTTYLKIKNIGNKDLFNGHILINEKLQPFLVLKYCDINGNCGNYVNLQAGETGFLQVNLNVDSGLGTGVEGIISIEELGGKNYELPFYIDRPPLYSYYKELADSLAISELAGLIILYIGILGIVFVFVISVLGGAT